MKYCIGIVVKDLLSNMHFVKTDAVQVMFYLRAQMKLLMCFVHF